MRLIKFGLTVFIVSPVFLSAKVKTDLLPSLKKAKPVFQNNLGKNLYAQNEDQLNTVIQEQLNSHEVGRKHQKKISDLAEKTRDINSDYQITLKQLANARSYNAQLKKLIKNQEEEMLSVREQTVEVKQTSKDIMPLMLEMIDSLEQFISLDMPFLLEERQSRIQKLKQIMDRADVSISEKYRRILNAYQIEYEYGKTIEVYQGFHTMKGEKKQHTNYLRVGRIALVYQSLDGQNQGYWNKYKKIWKPLSARYKKSIERGIKIAKKQLAPDLLTLPIPAPLLTQPRS